MSIQNLIDAATPGSIINILPGVYNEQLVITKPLTLQSPPTEEGVAVIDAAGLANIPTIHILSSNVAIRGFTIKNGPLHGVRVGDSTSPNLTDIEISGNHIKDNGNAGIVTNHGASMTIKNNTIENNGTGSGFNRVGIVLYPHGATSITNNIIIGNAVDGVFARESATGLVIADNIIKDHPNSGISLAWDQRNTTITNNHIKNCGTGNFDEEGGIVIIQSMAEVIQGNVIEDCRVSGIFWGWVPTTGGPPDEILISNNRIKGSSRDAIYLFSQGPGGFIPPDIFPLEPVIQDNVLSGSGRAGVYVSNAYYYSPGNANPVINHNEILNNDWGVFNATAQVVNAINNWWGSSSGPFHPELNSEGMGNPVSNNVDFTPWLTEPPAIQVIGCSIKAVNLENYEISPVNDEFSRVNLIFKVSGDASLAANGSQGTFDFETWFAKALILCVPKSDKVRPTINFTATCYATPINDTLQVDIELCVVVSIQGKYDILAPSLGFCPIPHCTHTCRRPEKSLSMAGQEKHETNTIECLSVEKVFDSCWFRKTLSCTVELS